MATMTVQTVEILFLIPQLLRLLLDVLLQQVVVEPHILKANPVFQVVLAVGGLIKIVRVAQEFQDKEMLAVLVIQLVILPINPQVAAAVRVR
jgi:hypothetical protein